MNLFFNSFLVITCPIFVIFISIILSEYFFIIRSVQFNFFTIHLKIFLSHLEQYDSIHHLTNILCDEIENDLNQHFILF